MYQNWPVQFPVEYPPQQEDELDSNTIVPETETIHTAASGDLTLSEYVASLDSSYDANSMGLTTWLDTAGLLANQNLISDLDSNYFNTPMQNSPAPHIEPADDRIRTWKEMQVELAERRQTLLNQERMMKRAQLIERWDTQIPQQEQQSLQVPSVPESATSIPLAGFPQQAIEAPIIDSDPPQQPFEHAYPQVVVCSCDEPTCFGNVQFPTIAGRNLPPNARYAMLFDHILSEYVPHCFIPSPWKAINGHYINQQMWGKPPTPAPNGDPPDWFQVMIDLGSPGLCLPPTVPGGKERIDLRRERESLIAEEGEERALQLLPEIPDIRPNLGGIRSGSDGMVLVYRFDPWAIPPLYHPEYFRVSKDSAFLGQIIVYRWLRLYDKWLLDAYLGTHGGELEVTGTHVDGIRIMLEEEMYTPVLPWPFWSQPQWGRGTARITEKWTPGRLLGIDP